MRLASRASNSDLAPTARGRHETAVDRSGAAFAPFGMSGLAFGVAAFLSFSERREGVARPSSRLRYNPWTVPQGVPFGEYRLLRRLGSGGMAEVFLAKRIGPKGFEKQLVIKRILPHLSASDRFTQLFLKEARLAALIDHPNLVHVSSFGEIEGNYYLAMEFVDGVTLAELQAMLGTLTPGVACRIAIDLLDALHAIHTARDTHGDPLGLVHRDVSPRNVMLTRDGAVKLLDFGIAVSKDEVNIGLMGTRRHMSPEQMRGQALDARSDLFCVGVLLYQLITGEAPFESDPDTLPARPTPMPEELWSTIRPTLAIPARDRPESARQIQAALELFVASRGLEGTRAHLAEIVSAVTPRDLGSARRALSRITQMTMTGIRRFTSPLSASGSQGGTPPRFGGRAIRSPPTVIAVALFTLVAGSLWLSVLSTDPIVTSLEPPTSDLEPGGMVLPHPLDPRSRVEHSLASSTKAPDRASIRALAAASGSDAPEPGDEDSAGSRSRPARPTKARPGTLTIDTRPWTEVYFAGRKLGLTPMAGVKLPSGRHEIELRNPGLGIVRRIQVTIRPGRVTRVQRVL